MSPVAEVNIPTGPIDEAPWDAFRRSPGEQKLRPVFRAALREALDGVELGYYDKEVLSWLAQQDTPTVATVCSLLLRVRAAAVEGHAEEIAALRAQLPECNGLCLRASDVLFDMSNVNGNPVARAHRSCPLHGDLEGVARELSAALTAAEEAVEGVQHREDEAEQAKAAEGRIVLDEPAELGIERGYEVLALTPRGIHIVLGLEGERVWGAAEAREWAAHLAAMADALDAAQS